MPHTFLLLLKHIVTITLFLLDRLTVLFLLANSHRTVPSERPTPKRSFFYYMQCMVLFSSLPPIAQTSFLLYLSQSFYWKHCMVRALGLHLFKLTTSHVLFP